MVYYKDGICTTCGGQASGILGVDLICHCLDDHEIGCTCKECSDLWEEIEAEFGDVSRDMSHARNYNI